jgi:6-phosphogluconolactonase (cycloisomerase 2 family)
MMRPVDLRPTEGESVTTAPGSESDHPLCAYVAIGPALITFRIDVEGARLERGGTIELPSRVQYAWPHARLPVLYVACADRAPGAEGQPFYLCALARDGAGELTPIGEPVVLPARPIHVTTDGPSEHVLTAYSSPAGLTVHALNADGSIGAQIPLPANFDAGSYPHQVRVTPANDRAIIVARGKKGFGGQAYISGGLKVLRYAAGKVENLYTVEPDAARSPGGFNPRHLDFHPTRPFVFVSLEEQNRLCVFGLGGPDIEPQPLFVRDMLEHPRDVQPRQDGGTVHVHPNGRFVYVANRNDGYVGGHKGPSWITPDPVPVFPGGENNIAVFRVDQVTGEPTLIQNVDTRGLHPRTFALDPTGRLLIVGNLAPTLLAQGDGLTPVPANLAIFRVGEDGTLEFVRRHDLKVGAEMVWWMGVVA